MQKDFLNYKFALLGENISHSLSPQIYRKLLGESIHYDLLDYTWDNLPSLKEIMNSYDFLNITSPYKATFINLVQTSKEVKDLGAINTIKKEGIHFLAENTDYLAIKKIIQRKKLYQKKDIFVLGDGVMAKIVEKAFSDFPLSLKFFSRKKDNLEDWRGLNLSSQTLLINTCSREYKLEFQQFFPFHFWDLNYSNRITELSAQKHRISYEDGRELLYEQAKSAVSFWNL